MIQNIYWRSCKENITVVITQWNLNFLEDFRRIPLYQISLTSVKWGPFLSSVRRTNGQTDVQTEIFVISKHTQCKLANAPARNDCPRCQVLEIAIFALFVLSLIWKHEEQSSSLNRNICTYLSKRTSPIIPNCRS